MSNLIFLSAPSIIKYLERQPSDLGLELPVIGKATVATKELKFHDDQLSLPIRHNIPLISDFSIDFEKFKCEDTKLSFEIGRVGFIPGFGIDILCQALAGYIGKILGGSNVEVSGNRIFIEMSDLLPENMRSLHINSLHVSEGKEAGIRIEFEF